MKYAFIESKRHVWPISLVCVQLEVSASGFHQWRQRQTAKEPSKAQRRGMSNDALLAHIKAIHAEVKGEYGWPRMWKELLDITYIDTAEGWLYLAVMLDLFSRQVVGWAIAPRMTSELVIDALRMAWFRRKPAKGLIVHTDRGSQYCGKDFQRALKAYGMVSSMSRKGDCWDNAPTESLWGSLKRARLHGKRFETRQAAQSEVMDWLAFYNATRLHSTLGYVSPMQHERNWLAAQEKKSA